MTPSRCPRIVLGFAFGFFSLSFYGMSSTMHDVCHFVLLFGGAPFLVFTIMDWPASTP